MRKSVLKTSTSFSNRFLFLRNNKPQKSVFIHENNIETKSISLLPDEDDIDIGKLEQDRYSNIKITSSYVQNNVQNYFYRLEAEIFEATTQELMMQEYPSDCFPDKCYAKFPCIVGDYDSPFWQGSNLSNKCYI